MTGPIMPSPWELLKWLLTAPFLWLWKKLKG